MEIQVIYMAFAAVVVAVPVAIVLGMAAMLAVGGAVGCTRCLLAASIPEPAPVRETARLTKPRYV